MEATTFENSSDARTKEFGGNLSVDNRSSLMNKWMTAGQYVPDWLKRDPKRPDK